MSDGFLGYKASFMLDVVVCALALVVPVLLYSIYVVKQGQFQLHRTLQLALGIVLLLTVGAFEVDLQLVHGGWENIVNKREVSAEHLQLVQRVLWVHLCFAITTPILWIVTIVLALRRFPNPPVPGPHSGLHKKLAWLSTLDITLTSVTGLIFYYFAFVAEAG